MHYCCLVFTNEFPTDEVIERKLAPYNEESFYGRYREDEEIPAEEHLEFLWDWYQLGGRYCGLIKMFRDESNKDYHWGYYTSPRSKKFFRSTILDKLIGGPYSVEENYLPYFYNDNDNSYRVDGAEVKYVLNKDLIGYCMVRSDGSVAARKKWNGNSFVENSRYAEMVAEEYKKAKYVCVVDIHE